MADGQISTRFAGRTDMQRDSYVLRGTDGRTDMQRDLYVLREIFSLSSIKDPGFEYIEKSLRT